MFILLAWTLLQEPSVREHFTTGMLDENYIRTNERFINFMTLQCRTLANVVSKWPGYELLAEKLHRHCDNIKENLVTTGGRCPERSLCLIMATCG